MDRLDGIVAPEAIGELGYRLRDIRIHDIFGLIDPYIARHGRLPHPTFTYGKFDYSYTMQQRPDIFLFHSPVAKHIPQLNRSNYSNEYTTYKLTGTNCWLVAGIRKSQLPYLLGPLAKQFQLELIDTVGATAEDR